MFFLNKIFKDPLGSYLEKISKQVKEINLLEKDLENLSDFELQEKALALKEKINQKQNPDDFLVESFALTREAAKRTLNQRHFNVQLLAGIALHQGKVIEMKTGEGKTLSSTTAIFLNGLSGKGVHVITVNDYLAKRDTVWMGQIYHLLGLTVSCLTNEGAYIYQDNLEQLKIKEEDIIEQSKSQNSKIKNDEEDIIEQIKSQNSKIKNDEEYILKENKIDQERDSIGSFKVIEDFLKPCSRKEAYLADITYGTNNEFGYDYLRDNLVMDREQKVQRGFNFAIIDEVDSVLIDEARTPLIISAPDEESSKYYQQFSRIAPQLKEGADFEIDEKMKAAFLTEKGIEKIEKILGVSNIYETHGIKYLHYLEQSLRAQRFFKKDIDYIIKQGEVIIIDEFTGRLMPGRRWSSGLHQAIEAKEGVEIKQESKTLATITFQNYFRLYEKLAGMTGTALTSAEEFDKVYNLKAISIPTNKPIIRVDQRDLIFKTENAKLKAIIAEIKNRHNQGQPVLIGTRSVEKNEYLSALLRREGIKHEILNAKNHQREGEIIAMAGRKGAVTVATNMAGRGVDIMLGGVPPNKFKVQSSKFKVKEEDIIEQIKSQKSKVKNNEEDIIEQIKNQNSKVKNNEAEKIKQRQTLENGNKENQGEARGQVGEEYRAWEKERQEVVSLGGLFVLGTERHEARRIDNQLRGRSGRQGDPGESQFFVSLEDDLMRIFGGEKIQQVMGILKIDENMPITSKMISSVIEKAQAKVENMNFDSRKYVLEYDDVIAKQRNKIYQERDKVLTMPYSELKDFILSLLNQEIENIFAFSESPIDNLKMIFPLRNKIENQAQAKEQAALFLQEKENQESQENLLKIFRFIILKTLDDFWQEHLVNLDNLKDSVRLRAYGGRDPLVEYKTESHKMFQGLIKEAHSQVARLVFKVSFK